MSACTELAQRLGKAIADSPQAAAYRAARKELGADTATSAVVKEYRKQVDKIAQLEEEQKPVEVEDKHKLMDLNGKLVSSPVFKKFTAAQVEYVDLMRKVNEALRGELAETEGQEEEP